MQEKSTILFEVHRPSMTHLNCHPNPVQMALEATTGLLPSERTSKNRNPWYKACCVLITLQQGWAEGAWAMFERKPILLSKPPRTPHQTCSHAHLCMQCLLTFAGPETKSITFVLPLPHTWANQLKKLLDCGLLRPLPPTAPGPREQCRHLLGAVTVARLSGWEAPSWTIAVRWYVDLFVFRTAVKFPHFADGNRRP